MTVRDREFLLGALIEEWATIEDLVHDLTPHQWLTATACPAWDVRDQIAHIIAAEYALAGQFGAPATTPESELYTSVGMFMVDVREESPPMLLERYREITAARLATLADLSDDEWAAPTWTPAGPGTVERLVRLRIFDGWMHEQDVRDALGRAGHDGGAPVDVVLDEIEATLGFVLARQARVPDGGLVAIALSGAVTRSWQLVVQDNRGHLVDTPPRTPDVTLCLPVGLFTRLCGGRIDPVAALAAVTIEGDRELGERIVAALAITR